MSDKNFLTQKELKNINGGAAAVVLDKTGTISSLSGEYTILDDNYNMYPVDPKLIPDIEKCYNAKDVTGTGQVQFALDKKGVKVAAISCLTK